MRHLVVILGDQLNSDSAAFDHFDGGQDALWTWIQDYTQ